MAVGTDSLEQMPVVRDLADFDPNSGSPLERLIFNNRLAVVAVCAVITVVLAVLAATKLTLNASFERMIPQSQPYIKNYLENQKDLRGLGNALRVVVENTQGDIYDPGYLQTLKKVTDELVLTPGVDRAWVKSLWTPAVRWTEVTEEGFQGGPVMPDNYDGSPQANAQLRANIARSGIVGSLVGNNFKSSMIFVPLLDRDPASGKAIDYRGLSRILEEKVRAQYELSRAIEQNVRAQETPGVRIHVIGFAKLVGELIEGLAQVMNYFAAAAAIATLIIFFYTRCVRSTALVVACSVIAVIWQLGLVSALGFELDPFSILVPFLVFAIGVSHGAQKMNGIMQDVGRGTHKLVAARYTFRRLFLAGLTALIADAVGFAVLMVIDIPVIRDLALAASVGVAVLIFTNLVLLPVLLSYTGVSPAAAARSLRAENEETRGKGLGVIWSWLDRFTERRWALGAIGVAAVLAVAGFAVSTKLQIGDLDAGAPELRPSFPVQPRQRVHHRQLLALERPARGHRQDAPRGLSQVPHAGGGRSPRLDAAAGARRADHRLPGQRSQADHGRLLRGQPEVAHHRPQPGRPQLRRAAGLRQQPGPLQYRMLGDAGHRLSHRSSRRNARPRDRSGGAVLCRAQRA